MSRSIGAFFTLTFLAGLAASCTVSNASSGGAGGGGGSGHYGRGPARGPATCNDGKLDGDETDVDCGGSCPTCATAGTCSVNPDCTSVTCPIQVAAGTLSISPVEGTFYANPNNSCTFAVTASDTALWTQAFPSINFNPPTGTVPGDTSGVGVDTRPFTDVLTDAQGNYSSTVVAESNGQQAGSGSLGSFAAVFTGTLNVGSPGTYELEFYSDDGWIFGVGGDGITPDPGNPNVSPPPSGTTFAKQLKVVASYNQPSSPAPNKVTLTFAAAGTYPFEADYTECDQGALAFTIGAAKGVIVPQRGACK